MTEAPVTTGARLIQGAPYAADIRATVATDVAAFVERNGHPPELAIVVCGHEAPSMVYLRKILDGCSRVGIVGRLVELSSPDELQVAGNGHPPASESASREVAEADLVAAIHQLNADPKVAGIIVQMPLPRGIRLRAVIDAIDPAKDIDGIHPLNAGLLRLGFDGFVPATPHAVIEMLHRSGVEIAGRDAVVVGRSPVIGMPVAFMLVKENATVTVCHRGTRDLAAHLRRADIVVVAAGRPGLVTGDMLKPGAVVIDVGINVVDGHIVGDVDLASARAVASAIAPVPGGVGPLTNALLLTHLIRAAERQATARSAPGAASDT